VILRYAGKKMITKEDAIIIAKRVAAAEGWTWLEPVRVSRKLSAMATKEMKSYDLVVNTNATGKDGRCRG
jgi:hypothetical protein